MLISFSFHPSSFILFSPMSYFADLMLRLAEGTGKLPGETLCRHGTFLTRAQQADGGFPGRRGASDLYYTSFAIRSLAMLGQLEESAAWRAADFLKSRLVQSGPGIDFLSLVVSAFLLDIAMGIDVFTEAGLDRRQSILGVIEQLRRDDGGYAKTDRGVQSSTYHTFLVLACKEMIGAPLERTAASIELIRARQREDGGFVEIGPMRQSGTNPTAAAIGGLRILGGLDEPLKAAAAGFLARMQTAEGGLRANSRIPAADLLSTFTGLAALDELGAAERIDLAGAWRFVQSLERPEGGFIAGAWDNAADVEYTFYGLGVLSLLSLK
jgi:geranylgeranyl transferase type-2 subunit beta